MQKKSALKASHKRYCLLCIMVSDERYMRRCLELAQKGQFTVAPNPMVGALLAYEGKIAGHGFHRAFGGDHAEVHAIRSVPDAGLLQKCTLYVNMEPCSHHGKTPPCTDLIIASGIPKVVVGQVDPNPLVAGSGIQKLKEAGVQVTQGVLQEECLRLNRRFNAFHTLQRPYVVLKWARSIDGFMDISRGMNTPSGPHWISHPATRKLVHRWRAEEAAILIGATTLSTDDPLLTARDYGVQRDTAPSRQPHRVVLSHRGNLQVKARLFHDGLPVEVVSHKGGPVSPLLIDNGKLKWTAAAADENLIDAALRSLRQQGFLSVLVEGGAETLRGFIESGKWDEARVITAPHALGKGMDAPAIGIAPALHRHYGTDLITTYFNA